MRELSLGEYIKQERIRQGITQEQLCEGICEPITISRMENGKQIPSYTRICTFLQRLGLPDDQYFALLNQNELEIKTLQDEIRADIVRFERSTSEKRHDIRKTGLQKLEKLEKLAKPDERIIRQYIFAMKISFGKPNRPYSLDEEFKLTLEALHITIPNFDFEEINRGLYSLDESTLINLLANIYVNMEQLNQAIDIYRQLLRYVQKHYRKLPRYGRKLILIAHNYTRTLFIAGRYDDALEIATLGQNACIEYAHYRFLPGLLELQGECYFHKGEPEKCKKYYWDAHCLYKVIGNDRNRLLLEETAKKNFNMNFSF